MANAYYGEVKVQGFKPFPWQRDVFRWLEISHGKKIVVKSHRQCGKSVMIVNIILKFLAETTNQYTLCISPSFGQCKELYNAVKNAIYGSVIYGKHNDSELLITSKTSSRVQFGSALQGDRLRGKTITGQGYLIVDEAAFVSDTVMNSILLPMTNVYQPTIIICSTPKFQNGFFYDWYRRAVDGDEKYVLVDFCNYDTSALLSKQQLEEYRKILPRLEFENEYLGQFLSADSKVFGDFSSVIDDEPSGGELLTMGIDWGAGVGGDYTAVVIFNEMNQMIYIDRWNDLDATGSIAKVKDIYTKFKPSTVAIEQNSIGNVFYDLLVKVIGPGKVRKFNTTNDSKNKLVDKFVVAIQNKNVTIKDYMPLKMEMTAFEVKQTPTGKVTYAAEKNGHDDLVMAMLIAFYHNNNINNRYVVR